MFRNPIVPGFAPDPSVVLFDGVFYLATSSFYLFPGVVIYASIDLEDWTHIGNVINRSSQLSLRNATTTAMPLDDGNVMVASGGLVAPTIRYNNGTFYIVCTNCYHEVDNWQIDNFFIHTKDIWSNTWSDPVYFPFYGVDPSLLFDDDGRVYAQGSWMIDRMKQPSCTIKQFEIVTAQTVTEIDITSSKPISGIQGPHIYKKDGWYYLLVAEGGTFEHHMLSIARAKNVWGPYESCPHNPIMIADGTDEYVQNMGHGEIFQDDDKTWHVLLASTREDVSIAKNRIPKNKKIGAIHPHVGNLYLHHPPTLDPYKTPSVIELVPKSSSLSDPHGTALLTRRQRSLDTTATATLVLNDALPGISAGLTVYKDPLRHASIGISILTRVVSMHFVHKSKEYDVTASQPHCIPTGVTKVHLRITASPDGYAFAFRYDGDGDDEEWSKVGEVDGAMMTARDFTGADLGVFALRKDGGEQEVSQGAVFQDFEFRDANEEETVGDVSE
ncbi:Arabinanase/levansucrase/invertase [Setomelanomma holmii]|uniref:Arabinanase/levansucrase/invertase n=1 Tax=Setomelanomma holmii TaxID=210430 RepID=A0A9P4H344_9PLEO|nr:Arabinanase/levansucrase/invertase [Setomelanomma holmii]